MLVLSRKKSECVVIDDTIIVSVVDIRGDKVRLGFEAPKNISVRRQEVWASIQRERNGLSAADSMRPRRADRSDGEQLTLPIKFRLIRSNGTWKWSDVFLGCGLTVPNCIDDARRKLASDLTVEESQPRILQSANMPLEEALSS